MCCSCSKGNDEENDGADDCGDDDGKEDEEDTYTYILCLITEGKSDMKQK